MKFIHCADLHLDSKIEGLPSDKSKKRREEIIETFERIANFALENSISVVLIGGDFFDTEKMYVSTLGKIKHIFKTHSQILFILIKGNHDEFTDYENNLADIPNLKLIGDKWQYFDFDDNTVVSAISLNNKNGEMFYDTLKLDKNKTNICMLHSGYNDKSTEKIISFPLLKDKYIDYLALGHYHSHLLNGVIDDRGRYSYCGCPEGRGFDELGDKGFMLLESKDNKVTNTFIKFSSRNLYEVKFSVKNESNWFAFRDNVLLDLKSNYSPNSLIKVIFEGEREVDFDIDVDGLTNKLNEMFFFAKVYDNTTIKISLSDFELDKSVKGEFVRNVLSSTLSEEEKQKIINLGLNALKGDEISWNLLSVIYLLLVN